MVDGLRILLRRVDPGLEHFKDEEIVGVDETCIDHMAFEIGETLSYQRRRHALSWHRRQTEFLELLHVAARAVADFHDFGRQCQSRKAALAGLEMPIRLC